jgi:hypothetical protein
MPMPIPEPIAAARLGTNPTVICRIPSGWAVMCNMQYLRGYTIHLSEPEKFRRQLPWFYPKQRLDAATFDLERDKELPGQIAAAIQRRLDGGRL